MPSPPIVVVVAGALAVWWWTNRSSDSTATAATTTKTVVAVQTGTADTTVFADGSVAAASTDNLNFASAGTVTAVKVVEAGDAVTAGQVLATIDGTSLDAAVAKAQADFDSANAKLSDDQDAGRVGRADRRRPVGDHRRPGLPHVGPGGRRRGVADRHDQRHGHRGQPDRR